MTFDSTHNYTSGAGAFKLSSTEPEDKTYRTSKALEEALKRLEHLDVSDFICELAQYATNLGGYSDVHTASLKLSPEFSSRRRHLFSGLWRDRDLNACEQQINTMVTSRETHEESLDNTLQVKVAVKAFRVHIDTREAFNKMIRKELRVWERMDHENILPLLGFMIKDGVPALISEWLENGTVTSYLNTHKEADRFAMIVGIAKGLAYLHSHKVVHSDLKGRNILVTSSGSPQIIDFGISRVLAQTQSIGASTGSLRGSARWLAPELIGNMGPTSTEYLPIPRTHTTATDVWAFGMVILEIVSGDLPYAEITNDMTVMYAIATGSRPSLCCQEGALIGHAAFSLLCDVCERCWSRSDERPSIDAVLEKLVTAEVTASDEAHEKLHLTYIAVHEAYSQRMHSLSISASNRPTGVLPALVIWDTFVGLRVQGSAKYRYDEADACAYACSAMMRKLTALDPSEMDIPLQLIISLATTFPALQEHFRSRSNRLRFHGLLLRKSFIAGLPESTEASQGSKNSVMLVKRAIASIEESEVNRIALRLLDCTYQSTCITEVFHYNAQLAKLRDSEDTDENTRYLASAYLNTWNKMINGEPLTLEGVDEPLPQPYPNGIDLNKPPRSSS